MTWISTISYDDSSGSLRRLYERVKGPHNQIDQILQAHALRPHTLKGHMALYKNVLHHQDNTLPKWYLECIGVYVSMLNDCSYCVEHHIAGLKKLNPDSFDKILKSLRDNLRAFFDQKLKAGLKYSEHLTKDPSTVNETEINSLKALGFSEGEILEINQVTGYFNYANRTVLGLGITTNGETLGMSPSGTDEESWQHQ